MRHSVLIALLSGLAVTPGIADDASKDLEKMQGSWLAISYTLDGKAWTESELRTLKLVIKGDRSTFTRGGETSQGIYKLDAAKRPRELDITLADGPDKGKQMLAIYEWDGDTLRICVGPVGSKERPREFRSRPGSGTVLEVWKRASP
jgi:uncharacterized protein (TIGR03067 family)